MAAINRIINRVADRFGVSRAEARRRHAMHFLRIKESGDMLAIALSEDDIRAAEKWEREQQENLEKEQKEHKDGDV